MSETVAEATRPPKGAAALPRESEREASSLREYIESLLVTVILALFGTSFVVQAFKIPSQSMEPTLLVGDHLLVNKFVFGGRGAWYDRVLPYRDIRRGDIVVFKFPFDDHAHYVKRVIGLPGDHLKIVEQQVFINGQALPEPYKVHTGRYDPYADNFPPTSPGFSRGNLREEWAEQILTFVHEGQVVVPPNKYFVMGDNRDHSWDSRYWGFADRESMMGRPVVVYWSLDLATEDYSDRSIAGRLVGLVHAVLDLPARTRWGRMFRTVH